jgi:histidinol-phosphate aminotransferase
MSDDDDLGPLAARVSEPLRGSSAYHVPLPPKLVAKMDANELPYGLPADLREHIGRELAKVPLERYPDPKAGKLRVALMATMPLLGHELVFGNGSDELIQMLVNAFAGPILFPTPTFVYYKLAAVARGVPCVEVPLRADFTLDEGAVIAAIERERPTVVFLALPNNPTGTLWRIELARELAERYRDTVIVSDEAYVAYSGASNLGALAAHPNLVIMRTLSKIGMAGLRVGFTISSPAIARVLEKVRPPYNVSALDQLAAALLISMAGDWCEQRAAAVVVEREKLAAALQAKGVEVFPSAANLVLVRVGDARATWQKLADAGISVRAFGDSGPLANCIRITVGTPAENAALLEAL